MSFSDIFGTFLDLPSYVSKRSFCNQGETTSWFWVQPQEGRSSRQLFGENPKSDFFGGDDESMEASSSARSDCCPLVADPKTVLTLLAFIAAATYFLRQNITKLLGRRKRSTGNSYVQDLLLKAFESFEEKAESLVDAGSWLNSLINHENWIGDIDFGSGSFKSSIEGTNHTMSSDGQGHAASNDPKEDTGKDTNNCLNKLLTCAEEAIQYMRERNSFSWIVQKTVISLVLKGNFQEVWKELKVIPEATKMGNCLSFKSECLRIKDHNLPLNDDEIKNIV